MLVLSDERKEHCKVFQSFTEQIQIGHYDLWTSCKDDCLSQYLWCNSLHDFEAPLVEYWDRREAELSTNQF